MRLAFLYLTSALGPLGMATAAEAQTAPERLPSTEQNSRTNRYDAAFFVQYAPRTALDVARRVPGFALDLGNVDARGFAGAAGNVVINGSRPSAKSESLEATLARIPASSVVRVEVGPGDLYGAEYAGKSQVLNVILSDEGGIDGNVTSSIRRNYTGHYTPNGSASAMIKRGASTINLSGGTEAAYNVDGGPDVLTDLDSGEVFERRQKLNIYKDFNPYISASWALERASDKSARLNARIAAGNFDLVQHNRVSPTGEPQRDDSLLQRYRNPVFEIGGDVTRPLAGGAVKLVGLATRRTRDNRDSYLLRSGKLEDGATVVGGFEQIQRAKQGETIGRVTWTRQDLGGFSFEAGGEAVLNTLNSDVELFNIDENGEHVRIDLPVDSARVKETRGEAFVNVGRTISPALRVDAGVTFEYSHLTVGGDASADRKLKFFKPNATIDFKPGGGWHTQFSVRRTVAQLNFYDFISAAELSNDRVNAGNENLVPQRAWEFRATIDRPILGDGLVKLDLRHDIISLFQDRVLIFDDDGNAFDAPGNIGTGKRYLAELTVDAPLSKLWTGLRAKFTGSLQRTRVEDPISGELRRFSDYYPDWEWALDVRRDSGNWSYGFVVSDRDRFTFFRTDEYDTNWNGGPYGTAFAEYRPDSRTAITFDIDNLFDTNALRERLLFFPNRADPELNIQEIRKRNRHLNLGVTIKRSFGGGASPSS